MLRSKNNNNNNNNNSICPRNQDHDWAGLGESLGGGSECLKCGKRITEQEKDILWALWVEHAKKNILLRWRKNEKNEDNQV